MFKKSRRGFTLPEVLVTVTVVAVLAAVVVPAVTQFATKGDKPATQEDLNTLRSAVTAYVSKNHTFPDSLGDIASFANMTRDASGNFLSNGLSVKIADAFVSADSGYVTLLVSSYNGTSPITCDQADILDTQLDGGTGVATDGTSGNLQFGKSPAFTNAGGAFNQTVTTACPFPFAAADNAVVHYRLMPKS